MHGLTARQDGTNSSSHKPSWATASCAILKHMRHTSGISRSRLHAYSRNTGRYGGHADRCLALKLLLCPYPGGRTEHSARCPTLTVHLHDISEADRHISLHEVVPKSHVYSLYSGD